MLASEDKKSLFEDIPGCRLYFSSNAADFLKSLEHDISFAVIDLACGLKENSSGGVSLDDYDSEGISAFESLENAASTVPVYIFESDRKLTETDKNIFLQRGANDVISGISPEAVSRSIRQIAEEIFMEEQGGAFAGKGYVLTFNTAQISEGSVLTVRYHGMKKKQALDSDSAKSMLLDAERPAVRFDDVIGAENAKDELRYFIKYLRNPKKFMLEGGKPAKGVLLYGPPGTGKTMLARAMAGESNVSFIQTSATEFMNKWVGQSEQNVRDIFARARKHAPTIIFIDEIDAIGKTRDGSSPHTESVLNTLLTELDGFKIDLKRPVFVLAATNYGVEGREGNALTLDNALVRRFDNKVYVDLPNEKERAKYISLAVSKKGFTDIDEDTIKNVAARTPGMSIALLQNIIDLAFRNAGRLGRKPNGTDLQNALEEDRYGEKHEWSEEYYKNVAIHESGHAYIAYLSGEKPTYMTIVSRGNFGGYMSRSFESKPSFTKEELVWQIRCALAGRAAEEVFCGKSAAANTGAASDLQMATKYALQMICEYGMAEGRMLSLSFDKIAGTPTGAEYLEKANNLINEEMRTTLKLVSDGKDMIERLASQVLINNNLTGEQIIAILDEMKDK